MLTACCMEPTGSALQQMWPTCTAQASPFMLLNDATGIAVLGAQHDSACPGPHCIGIFPSWLHRRLDRVKEAFPPSEANAEQGSHARQCVASWGLFRKHLQSRIHVHIRSLPALKGGFLSSAAIAEQGSHAHQWLPVSRNGFSLFRSDRREGLTCASMAS